MSKPMLTLLLNVSILFNPELPRLVPVNIALSIPPTSRSNVFFILSSFQSSYRRWFNDLLPIIRDLYRFRPGPKSIDFHSVISHRRPWLTLYIKGASPLGFRLEPKHAFQGLFFLFVFTLPTSSLHLGSALLSVLRVVSSEYCTLFIMRSFAHRRSLVVVVIFSLD